MATATEAMVVVVVVVARAHIVDLAIRSGVGLFLKSRVMSWLQLSNRV